MPETVARLLERAMKLVTRKARLCPHCLTPLERDGDAWMCQHCTLTLKDDGEPTVELDAINENGP